jgi:release factor glutamine methyltransferase
MNERYTGLRDQLTSALQFLPDKPEETPDSTLRALWHAAAGAPKSAELAVVETLPELDARCASILDGLVRRRIGGEPLAHITGRQRFMGLEMLAGPEALVPRKETELLGQAAVAVAREFDGASRPIRVLDICTGAGNLALAIAHQLPEAAVFGADISEQAVALARRNAIHLGLQGRVQFFAGDLLAPFDTPDFHGSVDLLTCNPPYISSARVEQMTPEISTHEPRLAFDGGPFGVSILMRLLQHAPILLRRGGWLAFEVGLGQGPALMKRMEKSGSFREVRPLLNENDSIRALAGRT